MYMYFEATSLLYALTVITLVIFLVGVYANIYLWKQGKAKSLHHKILYGPIMKALFCDVLLQVQLLKLSLVRWFMHMCLFWGFLGLLAHTTFLAIMSHFVPPASSFALFIFEGAGRYLLDVWGDLWGLILFLGIAIAILRRYIFKAQQLDTIISDTTTLLFLLMIVVTGFFSEAQRLASTPFETSLAYSFIGNILASLIRSFPFLVIDYITVVWVHTLISLVFIGYIPLSKMWHVFVSPVEIALDASEKINLGEPYGRNA